MMQQKVEFMPDQFILTGWVMILIGWVTMPLLSFG